MLLVILYFLIVAVIAYGLGLGVLKLLHSQLGLVETIFLGLAGITVLATCWAFFMPLGGVFSVFLMLLTAVMYALFTDFKTTRIRFAAIKYNVWQVLFFVSILVVVALAASMPAYLVDNESYYIQTIKWLNSYGFVPGLGNLHIFLIQQSGLHILQAALDFDTVYDRINDISAFYLLVGLCWSAFAKAESPQPIVIYFKRLFPTATFLFLLLATSPTADLPVYVLSYYVIYKFLIHWHQSDLSHIFMMLILSLLVAYFKVTATLLVVFPLILLIKNLAISLRYFVKAVVAGLLFFVLFVAKNMVISGLPMYPLTTWTPVRVSWQVNEALASPQRVVTAALQGPSVIVGDSRFSWVEQAKSWLFQGNVETYLNTAILVVFMAGICFLFKFKDKSMRWVLGVFLLQSVVLFFVSSQFRFFFNLLYPAVLLIGIVAIGNHLRVFKVITHAGFLLGLLVFVTPQLVNKLTDNPMMKNRLMLQTTMLVIPSEQSIVSKAAYQSREGNMIYYHAKDDDFFWSTNDVPLPAVQKKYLEYTKYYFKTRPQMRGASLKNGFYADESF